MLAWREDFSGVIPAKAGIHGGSVVPPRLDARVRGHDGMRIGVWVAGVSLR